MIFGWSMYFVVWEIDFVGWAVNFGFIEDEFDGFFVDFRVIFPQISVQGDECALCTERLVAEQHQIC